MTLFKELQKGELGGGKNKDSSDVPADPTEVEPQEECFLTIEQISPEEELENLLNKVDEKSIQQESLEKFKKLIIQYKKLLNDLQKIEREKEKAIKEIQENSPYFELYTHLDHNTFSSLKDEGIITSEKEDSLNTTHQLIQKAENKLKEKKGTEKIKNQIEARLKEVRRSFKEAKEEVEEIIRQKIRTWIIKEKPEEIEKINKEFDEPIKDLENQILEIKENSVYTAGLELEKQENQEKENKFINGIKNRINPYFDACNGAMEEIFKLIVFNNLLRREGGITNVEDFKKKLIQESEEKKEQYRKYKKEESTQKEKSFLEEIHKLVIDIAINNKEQITNSIDIVLYTKGWYCDSTNLFRENDIKIRAFLQREEAFLKKASTDFCTVELNKAQDRLKKYTEMIRINKILGIIVGHKWVDKKNGIKNPLWEIAENAKQAKIEETEYYKKQQSKRK